MSIEIEIGKLICITEGSNRRRRTIVKLECQNVKQTKIVKVDLKDEWLSVALEAKQKQSLESLDGCVVEFERNKNNDPYRIWEQGKEWDRQETTLIQAEITPKRTPPDDKPKPVKNDRFHNPYNFVPALPRNHLPKFDPDNPKRELNDAPPVGHGRYLADYWSGRISVKLKTVTPLLIPDAAEMNNDANDHKTYPVRLGADGKPYLPPTSIKGMLRSAYEAVTNSRFGVFEKHDKRLAYRMDAREGTTAKPARVEKHKNGKLYLRILEDSNCVGGAAKLPRYEKTSRYQDKGESKVALKYRNKNLPQHGDPVRVKLSKGKVQQIELWDSEDQLEGDWKLGWVCVTGANIGGKQNERVFIQHSHDPAIEITPEIRELWENLIADYQKIHEKDLKDREKKNRSPRKYYGNKPGDTAWSRHIYDKNQLELKEGTLCYVELDPDCDSKRLHISDVIALQPVTISRRLYDQKPRDLLPESLHPAVDLSELSPADRVFGWVNQKHRKPKQVTSKTNSYKGQLRIHSVECQTPKESTIISFKDSPLPLAILGEPKPAQTRFYTAADKQGKPMPDKEAKEYGYESKQRGLRGRKVYPHHVAQPETYWSSATDAQNQKYRRPNDERDSQNKSLESWVNPNTEFAFDIDIVNLSSIELGALLWLLKLPENHYHRLGGGKPLGFGSVSIEVTHTDLRTGEDWKTFYSSLSNTPPSKLNVDDLINIYCSTVESAYGKSFETVPFIQAFYRCAKGFDDGVAIHYPWNPEANGQHDSNGENFKWFGENEQGDRWSLPSLVSGSSLPLNPRTQPKVSNQNQAAWQRSSGTSKTNQ